MGPMADRALPRAWVVPSWTCLVTWILLLVFPTQAQAYEETVRRDEVDGGVHVPVLTKAPELLEFVAADYPEEATQQGLTAEVRLMITIGPDGTVTDAVVPEPVGHGFDEAAQAAVRQFKFSPAEVDGVPSPVVIEYIYHFTLSVPDAGTALPELPPKAVLQGQVIARGSRTRVNAATVRCSDAPEAPEALSGEDGRFRLEVPAGTCDVKVVANGFHLFESKEELLPGQTTEVILHVIPKAVGYETVVRGVREKKEVVRRTLERQELQKVPGSFGDPVRVLQNFPGVARAPLISGALIVRGASPDQTLFFLDGVEIPILYHLGGGPSVVNGEFLDRIDFFPGGFGAKYGRAVGGIVDVATRRGASDTVHGVAKVDLQDASVFVETPVAPGVSVAAAARRSYIDALLPLVLPKDPQGGSLLVVPQYWDYQVRVDVGSRGKDASTEGSSTFSAMAFGSDDVLKVVATGGGRDRDVSIDVHTLFHRAVANWTYRKGDTQYVLSPYVGYDLAKFSFGTSTIKADRYAFGARQELSLDLSKNFVLRAGNDLVFYEILGKAELPVIGDTQYVGFPGAEPRVEQQTILRELQSFDGALYTELDMKLGPVTVTPGIRGSHAFLNGNGQTRRALDPRLWVRYAMLPSTTLKGSVGLYTQPPDVANMEQPPFGTPSLVHEKAFQGSVGFEQKLTESISVDVTGYYNRRYDNVVQPGRTTVNEDGSVTQERSSNDGLGRAYGMEVLLRHDVTREFFGWVAYTLGRSETRRVGADKYQLTSFDQTHILTAVGSYRLPLGFELGARFRYVTGRPKTPLAHVADVFNADENSYSGTFGEFRSSRQKAFQQLDLRLDKSFLFESWTLTAFLDVQNVYNAQNTEFTFFDYRYRQEVDVPGIPVLPILGVKGSF